MANEITHCGVTGPVELWRAIGYEVRTPDHVTYSAHDNTHRNILDAAVYEGRRVTGRDDWQALSWAAAERQRQTEACTAATAQAREADGLAALANAIGQTSDESVLDRVLSRLSERTQYAVRQQLKGSGIGGR